MTIRDCVFRHFDGGPVSGGAVVVNGNASFINCEFSDCTANVAGALWSSSGHLDLIGCRVTNCHNTPVYVQETGGGTVSAIIKDCAFINNTSVGGAGGMVISTALGGSTISNCLFKGNVNTGVGGGGLGLGQGPKTVEDCLFIENGAMGPNGQGGGLRIGGSISIVRNNTFFGNYKMENPANGAAVQFTTFGTFENNIIVGSHGGGAVDDFGGIQTSCNVYWGNAQGIGVPLAPTDREVDPQFCDAGVYDLSLEAGSPCLPEDPSGCGLIGALEQGCGPISVESKSWGAIKSLYR
jgi:hypothetical protein